MRNKKKLCAGILMLLLLTGCSSQEVLQEVPQTIVLPESQIDTMPVQETAAAENDNTESFSLLEEGGSRFAYESLDAQEQIWYQEIEQAIGSMDDTIKLSTEPLEQGMDEQIELGGSFCMGKCSRKVSVKVDDEIYHIGPEEVDEFFFKIIGKEE